MGGATWGPQGFAGGIIESTVWLATMEIAVLRSEAFVEDMYLGGGRRRGRGGGWPETKLMMSDVKLHALRERLGAH